MDWANLASWTLVGIGAVISYWCVRSTLYFRHQLTLGLAGNWILRAFYTTSATISGACIWFTVARAITLAFGVQWWTALISGIAVIWLLSIPILLARLFKNHEGR